MPSRTMSLNRFFFGEPSVVACPERGESAHGVRLSAPENVGARQYADDETNFARHVRCLPHSRLETMLASGHQGGRGGVCRASKVRCFPSCLPSAMLLVY